MQVNALIPILVTLCFVGCTPSTPTEKLIGKWGLDVECTLQKDPEIKGLTKLNKLSRDNLRKLYRFVEPTFDTFFFEFERDGRLSIKRNHVEDAFDFTVVNTSKDEALSLSISPMASNAREGVLAQFTGSDLQLKIKNTTYCLVAL